MRGSIVCFVTLNLGEDLMKASNTIFAFRKTAACPASATLLSFRCDNLPADVASRVKEHLELCDFCNAELPLLAHHQPATGGHRTTRDPNGPAHSRGINPGRKIAESVKSVDGSMNRALR